MLDTLKVVFNQVFLRKVGYEYLFKNKNVEKLLIKFVKNMPAGAGEDWLYNFTIFQFAHYNGMKTQFGRIYLNWIYGQKALERWANRTDAQIYFAQLFKMELGVCRDLTPLSALEYKDNERQRFTDINRRFIHCYENALFSSESKVCEVCKRFKACSKKRR